MGQTPWDAGIEPGDGKPRPGSAVGCLICSVVFVGGLVLIGLEIAQALRTGTLPGKAELSGTLFASGVILLMGGFAGRFGARWALARGDWPGRLIPTLARVSWFVGLAGLAIMGILLLYGFAVLLPAGK